MTVQAVVKAADHLQQGSLWGAFLKFQEKSRDTVAFFPYA